MLTRLPHISVLFVGTRRSSPPHVHAATRLLLMTANKIEILSILYMSSQCTCSLITASIVMLADLVSY